MRDTMEVSEVLVRVFYLNLSVPTYLLPFIINSKSDGKDKPFLEYFCNFNLYLKINFFNDQFLKPFALFIIAFTEPILRLVSITTGTLLSSLVSIAFNASF